MHAKVISHDPLAGGDPRDLLGQPLHSMPKEARKSQLVYQGDCQQPGHSGQSCFHMHGSPSGLSLHSLVHFSYSEVVYAYQEFKKERGGRAAHWAVTQCEKWKGLLTTYCPEASNGGMRWGGEQIPPTDVSFLTPAVFDQNLPIFKSKDISHMHRHAHPHIPHQC